MRRISAGHNIRGHIGLPTAVFAAAALTILFIPNPFDKTVFFSMVDVGQGDGFFMEGPEGVTYLFDGGSSDQSQPGKYILEPYLKCRGIGEIDYVFLSHGDEDHVNGVEEMLERQDVGVKIGTLVLPVRDVWDDTLRTIARLAEENGCRVLEMDAGASLTEGTLIISALYPESGMESGTGNDASLVLDIQYDRFSVLMTGDLGKEGEAQLLEQNQLKHYTILKVGHHGSKNSTSEEFLQAVEPQYAWISAGAGNRYGHPHRDVLDLLEKYGIAIRRTDQEGAVEMKTDGKELLLMNGFAVLR